LQSQVTHPELALQQAEIGLLLLDDQQRIIYWNAWLERLSGLGVSDVLGKRLTALFPELAMSRLEVAILQAFDNHQATSIKFDDVDVSLPLYQGIKKEKNKSHLGQSYIVKPLMTAENKYCCLIQVHASGLEKSSVTKINSGKLTQSKELLLATLMDSSLDGVFTLDDSGLIETCSASALRLFESYSELVVGKKIFEFIPALKPQVGQNFRDMLQILGKLDGHLLQVKQAMTGVSLQGNTTQLETIIREVDSPAKVEYVAIVRDIEVNEKLKEKRFREKDLAQVVLNAFADAVVIVDADQTVKFANMAAETLLGLEADGLLGQPFEGFFSLSLEGEDKPIENIVDKACSRGMFLEAPPGTILYRRNKSCLPVTAAASPYHDENHQVSGCVVTFRDVSEERKIETELSWQAQHDVLTGLPNRSTFNKALDRLVEGAKEYNEIHALLYVDLDQFKIVNDTCGHAAGDELLVKVAGIFKEHLRSKDLVARLGGDEFAVLLRDCNIEGAQSVAETLCDKFHGFSFGWHEKIFNVGASIGVVTLNRMVESSSAALGAADAACYTAKEEGRNRAHVYQSDAVSHQRHGEMKWVARINEAFAKHRFRLFCQPIFPIVESKDCHAHFEVLIRMVDEEGKLVPPGNFIPAAERFGLMTEIDRWVVENSFKKLAELKDEGLGSIGFSINLSGPSVGNESFFDFVQEKLQEFGVRTESVCFEITETAAIGNLAKAQRFIEHFRKLGCEFSLDDFGSGLSSFAYLKELPVDYLKIDGMFVKEIHQSQVDFAMVSSINHLGHVMGVKTVAEFVENQPILDKLKELGVDYAQGYGLAEPRALDGYDFSITSKLQ